MKGSVICLAVLAVMTFGRSAAAPSSRSCRCWVAADMYQQGRLYGRHCYTAGLGRCGSFTLDYQPRRVDVRSPLRRRFSPQRQRQAQLATLRQLAQQRRREKLIASSGEGVVRPGSPAAALAHEKRADAKSLALGQQALAQILYLQNLVGTGHR